MSVLVIAEPLSLSHLYAGLTSPGPQGTDKTMSRRWDGGLTLLPCYRDIWTVLFKENLKSALLTEDVKTSTFMINKLAFIMEHNTW